MRRALPAILRLAIGALLTVSLASPASALLPQISVSPGPGWSASLVPRTTSNADTLSNLGPSPQLSPTQGVYLNWVVAHNAAVFGYWTDQLLVDAGSVETDARYNDVFASRFWFSLNRGPFFLRGGRHTLTGMCDIYHQTGEDIGSQGNNIVFEQYLWTPEALLPGTALARATGPPPEAPSWLLPNCDAFAVTHAAGVAWATAIKASNADYDLLVFDDYVDSRHGLTNERARSERRLADDEIVVGTLDTPGTLYPAVVRIPGTAPGPGGGYRVHHVDALGRVDLDGEAYWGAEGLTGNELVRLYQVELQAGVTYPISVWRVVGQNELAFAVFPATGNAIFMLGDALVESRPTSDPERWVASFQPPVSGTYAIAVYDKTLAGSPPYETRYRLAVGSQSVGVDAGPPTLAFAGAAPNPAAGATNLRWSLAVPGRVRLDLLDVGGRRVRTLVDGVRSAGPGEASWNLADDSGHGVPPGIYWARFESAGFSRSTRIAVVR